MDEIVKKLESQRDLWSQAMVDSVSKGQLASAATYQSAAVGISHCLNVIAEAQNPEAGSPPVLIDGDKDAVVE